LKKPNGKTLVKKLVLCSLVFWSAQALSAPEGKVYYITDQVTATMREAPRMEAAAKRNLRSGTNIYVLESLGPDSFARVRTTDGVEGWIPSRYISTEPAASERLQPLQVELAQTKERVKALEKDLAQTRDALAKAAPALQVAEENEQLKQQLAQKDQEGAALQERYSEEEARRKTLMVGAALIGGGIIAGLILPALLRGSRRRGGF
jgi:SH3 domain protein